MRRRARVALVAAILATARAQSIPDDVCTETRLDALVTLCGPLDTDPGDASSECCRELVSLNDASCFCEAPFLGFDRETTGRVGPGVGDGAQEVRRQHARGHPVPGPAGGGGGGGRGGGGGSGGDRGKVRDFDADPAGAGRMRGYPHGHVLRDNRATQRREVLLRGRRGGRVAIVSREFPFHVRRRAPSSAASRRGADELARLSRRHHPLSPRPRRSLLTRRIHRTLQTRRRRRGRSVHGISRAQREATREAPAGSIKAGSTWCACATIPGHSPLFSTRNGAT